MQPMWLCIFWGRHFEETYENPQWRKVIQMQPMWLCIFWGRHFEETYENAQWRKIKQMQSMWLCIFSGRRFEKTYENAQWWKAKWTLANVTLPALTQVLWGDMKKHKPLLKGEHWQFVIFSRPSEDSHKSGSDSIYVFGLPPSPPSRQ